MKSKIVDSVLQGCQPPTLLRNDREGIIDDVTMYEIWCHLCKKTCKIDVVGIVTLSTWLVYFPPITLLKMAY